jgi:hypothetical protein
MKLPRKLSFSEFKYLTDPKFKRLFNRPYRVVKTFDVPYVGGYSRDGSTVYFDRHANFKMPNGKDIQKFIEMHEKVEKALIDGFGLKYQEAHLIATAVEHDAVVQAGINWEKYSRFIDRYIKLEGHEKLTSVPKDLDLKPYKDERDNRLVITLGKMEKART